MSLERKGLGIALIRAANAALGFALGIGLAIVFGTGRDMDALVVAMSVAVLLARDLATVLRTALVPCLVENAEGGAHGPGLTPALHAAALGAAALLAAAVFAAANPLAAALAPGFDAETSQQAARLLRTLAPCLLLFALFGVAQGFFHAQRRFFLPEAAETVWRLLALACLFGLGPRGGVEAYAAGLTLATFVQWALLLACGAGTGLRLLPRLWPRPLLAPLRPLALGALCVLCTVLQVQVEATLDRAMLSCRAPGDVALLAYAARLAHMAPLLFSTSLLLPWLPEMTRIRARAGDSRRFARQGAAFLAAFGALLAMLTVWGARDIVSLMLLHGRFDAAAAPAVTAAVQALALGVPGIFCAQCLAGLLIVERNLRELGGLAAFAVAVHLAGNLLLWRFGVPGIALSGSLTASLAALWLWWRVRAAESVWFPWPRFTAALAAAGAALYAVPWARWLPLAPLRLAVGGLLAWAAYAVLMRPALQRMRALEQSATGAGPASRPETPALSDAEP